MLPAWHDDDDIVEVCDIYVYIKKLDYIYIMLHGSVCDPRFHAFCIHQTEWKFSKKKKKDHLIWLIFVKKVGVMCVYMYLSLCAIEC